MPLPAQGLDVEGRRLLWRCRRGLKELDVLLERYVRLHLPAARTAERRALTQLLEMADPDLADCLLGHAIAPEPEVAALVERIRHVRPGEYA